ncbi:MAG: EamA family transporter [Steroidobacteraceae bacterium]|jgi:drug/metabolite transporter (DMT)-like permease|nr:EamA family transporter [Pseudomonadota bacterium]MBP7610265.1 EamA family transporter [Steroidobacteraceae bacterium]MBP9129946.1 EamA family transporter [Steroidobacteraceae bacterium]
MTGFRARLYACFALVYLVWGSSFLVGRIGVSDLPPLLFTSLRSLIAGVLLLGLALYRGNRLPDSRHEWRQILFFALVLIAFSSGSATFALKYIASNEVALLNASMALWIAGLGTLGPKGQKLSVPSLIGLALGFVGVALLVWPEEMRLTPHVGWQLLVLAAAAVWASGTIVYRNSVLQLGPIAFNAMIMLVGGLMLGTAGVLTGELPDWHWEWRGMSAIVFLAVFASAITYTAFTWLMKNARTDRVATFAYVNPAIATVLGWLVLGESLRPQQMVGMLVVLGGVVLVTMPHRYC